MSSTGTEHYSRIMLTLMKGGTKLTRRLVEKRVKDLSKNGGEDTIDEFLLKNKSLILEQKLGKNKQDVIFPQSGQTNLDYWDLCMFCSILEETCDLTHITKMYIKKLLKIRNKLCHLNDPTLETRKFDEYTEHMKCCFEHCLKEINDDKFTEEMNALVQSLATGPLSIDDTLKAVHKLYHLEWTYREELEKIGNGQDSTNGKIDTLIGEVRGLNSRLSSDASAGIPGIGIVIEVEKCSAEMKKEILDILEKNFNEAIEQKVPSLEEDLPNGALHTIRETVIQVFREFLIMGRHVTSVKQKCLLLTIKCTSVKSFLEMIRDYRTGDLSKQLSGIETAIKNLPGCGNVQLTNLIFKDEFMELMANLVSKLHERVLQAEYTAAQISSNAVNSIRVTLQFPTLSERETVQNRFETKMFVNGMKRIETELRQKLNVESMSLTAKLVKDEAVTNFDDDGSDFQIDEESTSEFKVDDKTFQKQATETQIVVKEEIGPVKGSSSERSGLKLKKEKRYHNNLFVKVENVGAINFVTVSSKEGMRVLMKSLCDELQIPEAAFESVLEKKMDSEKIVCEKDEEGNGLKEYISQDFEKLTPEERGNVTSEVNRRAGEEFANLHRKMLTQLDVNLFAEYMKCVGALINNGELFGTVFRAGDVYLMTTFDVIQRIIDPCNTGQADYTLIEAENVFVNFNSSVLDIPDYKFRVRHVISTDTPLLDYTVLQIINNNDTLPKGLKLDKKPHNTETRPLHGIGYGNPETPFYKVLDNSSPIISSNTRILDCVKWLDETIRGHQDKNVPQVAGLNRSQYFEAHVQAMGFDPDIVDKGYQCIGREHHIFINARMEHGASGSPFLTSDGCVKGVLISCYPAFYFHLPKIVRSGFPRDKRFECILKLEYVHQHILERDPEIANKLFG